MLVKVNDMLGNHGFDSEEIVNIKMDLNEKKSFAKKAKGNSKSYEL